MVPRHAFEHWGAVRITLKTDAGNLDSQAAIRKLGASYVGTLRRHRIRPDGSRRDSVYLSVLDSEPAPIRNGLLRRLGREPVPLSWGGSNESAMALARLR